MAKRKPKVEATTPPPVMDQNAINLMILNQLQEMQKQISKMVEPEESDEPVKKLKKTVVVEEVDEKVDKDLFEIKKKDKKARFVTKAKCVPIDPGGDRTKDKIKYAEPKPRRPGENGHVKECENCSKEFINPPGIKDYLCRKCLVGRR